MVVFFGVAEVVEPYAPPPPSLTGPLGPTRIAVASAGPVPVLTKAEKHEG